MKTTACSPNWNISVSYSSAKSALLSTILDYSRFSKILPAERKNLPIWNDNFIFLSSQEEFRKGMKVCGVDLNDEETDVVWGAMDVDGDGDLTAEEICTVRARTTTSSSLLSLQVLEGP